MSIPTLKRALHAMIPACLGLALATVTAADPVGAQSLGVGLNFADVSVWSGNGDAIGTSPGLSFTGDFRTGEALGVQLDLSGEGLEDRLWGKFDLHLYLAPQEGLKYGFYASIADMDGQELTVAHAGVELMYQLSLSTVLEARAGMGIVRGMRGSSDFVTVTGAVNHALSNRTAVFAGLTISEFQETRYTAVTYDALAGVRHALGDGRVELMAAVGQTSTSGRDEQPSETVAMLGLTWRFTGVTGQKRSVAHRAFGTWDPAPSSIVLARF